MQPTVKFTMSRRTIKIKPKVSIVRLETVITNVPEIIPLDRELERPIESTPYSMTPEILEQRLQKPTRGRLYTQLYSCITLCIGTISYGTTLGWSSGPMMIQIYGESEEVFGNTYTWVTAMVPLGSSFGVILWNILVTTHGPRKTLLVQAPVYLIMWLILANFLKFNITMSWCRFFLGFFGISYITCGRILLGDSVHSSLYELGRISLAVSMLLGVFLSHILAIYLSMSTTTFIVASIPVIQFILLFFMPESPVFMIRSGEKYAEESLNWYQGSKNISDSMRRIRRDHEFRRLKVYDYFTILSSNVVIKALFIIIGLVFFEIASGYYIYLFYGTRLWSKTPFISESFDTIITCLSLVLSKAFWMIIHYRFDLPTRSCLILSCLIVSICQMVLTCKVYFFSYSERFYRACIFSYSLIILGGDLGLNYYPSILVYEYLPVQVHRFASTTINAMMWFLIFAIVKLYGYWHSSAKWAKFLPFAMSSFISLCAAVFVYFFVVEYKERSLIQIQCSLGGNPVGTRGGFATGGRRNNAEDSPVIDP